MGSAVADALQRRGGELVRWDRHAIPTDDYAAMEAFVRKVDPDVLLHLAAASQPQQRYSPEEESWRVNYEWTSELAWLTRELDIPFVFTSTVMVFTEAKPGPYTIACRPDAAHDYGRVKRLAEARAFHQNPRTRVVRLGWQIGNDLTGNQMAAWFSERKSVDASTRWLPACAFVDDTADALLDIAEHRGGIYHLDANEGWSFYDLGCALRERHNADWRITPTPDRAYDQRLLDGRIRLPRLADRLPQLK